MKGGRDCPRRDRRLILGKRRVVKDAQSKSFDLAIRFLFFDKRSLFVRPFSRAQGFIPRIFHYSLSLGGEGVRKRKEDKPCRVTQNLRLVLTKRARIMCSNGDTLSRGLEEAPGANACRNYTRWFECFCPPRSIVTLQEFGRWKNYSTLFPTSLK